MRNTVIPLALLFFFLSPLTTAENFEFWPGASYDPAVPTLEKVVGHQPGERITARRTS